MPALPPPPNGLVSVFAGGTADWSSGAAQTVYTAASNINGMPIVGAYGRSFTGTQPVSIQMKVAGQNWGGAITMVTLIPNSIFVLPFPAGLAAMLLAGQTIQMTPALASAGTMTFDVVGYSF